MKCKNQDCDREATEGFPYCRECYTKWTQTKAQSPSEKAKATWHEDPIVDALLKINSNMSGVKTELQAISKALEVLIDLQRR